MAENDTNAATAEPEVETQDAPDNTVEETKHSMFDALYGSLAPERESEDDGDAPRSRSIHDYIGQEPEDTEEGDPPDPDAEDQPPKEDEPPPDPPKKKVAVRKQAYKPPQPEDTRRPPRDQPPPPPSRTSDEPAKQTQPKVDPSLLSEDEQEQYELATYAAKKFPDKHKDLPGKLESYFAKRQEFIDSQRDEDPDFSEEDPEFKRWDKKNRPEVSRREMKAVERAMIRDEVSQEFDKKLNPLRREVQEVRSKPAMEREFNDFGHTMNEVLPPDVLKAIQSDGLEKAEELFPVEYDLAYKAMENVKGFASEFLQISHGLKPVDPRNPRHKTIQTFISEEQNHFAKHGGDARFKDGRQFVPLPHYVRLTPEQKQQAWTWGNKEILDQLRLRTKEQIDRSIQKEHERLERAGYRRQSPQSNGNGTPAPARKAPPEPVNSPRSRTRQAPGPSTPATGEAANPVFDALWGNRSDADP